jgi:site-specific recombinase XerD
LLPAAVAALEKMELILKVGHYSPATIVNYRREIRLLLEYYPDLDPADLSIDLITRYLLYCKEVLGSGFSKCHLVAQSVSFLFKHVLHKDYRVPSVLYPRKPEQLPDILSEAEVKRLIESTTNLKHRTILALIYSTGLRLNEASQLRMEHIDSTHMRIKVVRGKGNKDRYTLLSPRILLQLRDYYRKYKPQQYLFNGIKKGAPISPRMIQHVFARSMQRAAITDKGYSVHTLRHCFATHLLDNGADIHTIKELLGHCDLKTTMIYMHLTTARVQRIINPYDRIMSQSGS